ncbi:Bifunctional glutamate/proline--tRNA ligase (Bifunctional aminoacyl-tRNA synthetase) [Includes: Glutamate--tRNA ligase (Glutamyl-tRNA synthetase) (GluRS) [Durusdinium trenchii]|uniref:Bifunctional glutamate/proline--tRNA ligase (Bifunctional aminoacyl-tRNA synthetase) n=1 Tax=Durusdinium trenchii TaxID=1381693 RepID=A0ABP0KQ81_9DINO
MEEVTALRTQAGAAGDKVRELKAAGGDFEAAVEELKAVKEKLVAAVNVVLPDKQKALEELKASNGAAQDIAAAEAVVADLQGLLPEDKAAKKKREREEAKKKKKAAAAAAGGTKDQSKQQQKGGGGGKDAKKGGVKATQAPTVTPAAVGPLSDARFPIAALVAKMVSGSKMQVISPLAETKLDNGSVLRGDITVARYISQQSGCLYGQDAVSPELEAADIEQWVELAQTYPMGSAEVCKMLDQHLRTHTYLVGSALSLADLAVWAALVRAWQGSTSAPVEFTQLSRWMAMCFTLNGAGMASGMYSKHLAKLASGTAPKSADKEAEKKANASGAGVPKSSHEGKKVKHKTKMPPLDGGEEGKVVTRFPPEPSGHLHIGHVKAIFLNKYYADRYNGKMLIRFDDTNPELEKVEFEEGILHDLEALGVDISGVSHTSDHFEFILKCAIRLIKQGDAFMDDTPQEQMSQERRAAIDSKRRNLSLSENLARFMGMVFGADSAPLRAPTYDVELSEADLALLKAEGAVLKDWCLRAKIDMQHKNQTLRDPVLFRSNDLPHARTKNTYMAYPTYDLACPIVDSIEGVTHALRDIQYRDRVPLYAWFFPKLGLREVKIADFSRLNFLYTLMSKRKLKWLIENGMCPDWDDPRFPTVKGIMRRGMQRDALYDFMVAQGSSKNATDMEWDKFWATNKKSIDPIAPRYAAIRKDKAVILSIKEADGVTDLAEGVKTVPLHPKDTDGSKFGFRSVFVGPKVLVEGEDLEACAEVKQELVKVGETVILFSLGCVTITKVDVGPDGHVTAAEGKLAPDFDIKLPKRKLHWVAESPHNVMIVAHEFDHLITKPKLEENDDFKDFIRENSHGTLTMVGEPGLRKVAANDFLQLLRRGFYRVDQPLASSSDGHIHLFLIPDGKTKAMSTLSYALEHR